MLHVRYLCFVALIAGDSVGPVGPVRPVRIVAQDQGPAARPFSVTAHKYSFDPARIEVTQDELIKIELQATDIAHSMTIDSYRISKRAGAGQSVTFEFRADHPGTFPYYCNLQIDDGCRKMRGELIVRPRR
jgi:cytochrome c oxidase subunit II